MQASIPHKSLYIVFLVYAAASLTAMAPMSIGAAGVVAVVALLLSRKQWGEELRLYATRRYLFVATLLALACILSLVGAWLFPVYYSDKHVTINWGQDLMKLWYLVFPVFIAAGLRRLDRHQRMRVCQVWLIVFAVLSLVGIFQFFYGWPSHQLIPETAFPGKIPRYHANVFLGHHLSLASIFIFPLFAALELSRRESGPKMIGLPRSVLFFVVLVGITVLLMTFSRMLWISLPVGLLLWAVWVMPKKYSAVLIILAVLAAQWIPEKVDFVRDRIRLINHGMRYDTRVELWKANSKFFLQRPLTGVGFRKTHELSSYYFSETFPDRKDFFIGHAHNNFFEMLGGTGILGTTAWCGWIVFVFWLVWAAIRQKPSAGFAGGLLFAWIVFHLNGLSQVNFWEGKVLHQMMWVVGWLLFWVDEYSQKMRTPDLV